LLRDGELRRRYERAAAALAAQYDWSAIGVKFGKVLDAVVNAPSATATQWAPLSGR